MRPPASVASLSLDRYRTRISASVFHWINIKREKEMKRKAFLSLPSALALAGVLFFASLSFAENRPVCGNGVTEGWEECDDAEANSDSLPNACRSNCVRAHCGDYAVDAGEECDDNIKNSNEIPDACRVDCRRAYCGDGVRDAGEECDDANAEAFDGCHQCQRCFPLKDDLVLGNNLGQNVRLCPGTYELADSNQEGVVTISGQGMRIDCAGAVLVGQRGTLAQAAAQISGSKQAAKAVSAPPSQDKSSSGKGVVRQKDLKRGLKGKLGESATNSSTGNASEDPGPHIPSGPTAVVRYGTGIVIAAEDVVLHDCRVENFRTGIKVRSSGNILFRNQACGNTTDIAGQANNFGAKNMCSTVDHWQENGVSGCSQACGN